MFLLYFFAILILIFLLCFAFIKIKFRFWSIQPVFHFYNLLYWMFPPGIINHGIPEINRYTNLKDIPFINYDDLSKHDKSQFIKFIQEHYLNTTDVKYDATPNSIIPYFDNTKNSFFSMYYIKEHGMDPANGVTTSNKLAAVMTSRLLNVSIHGNDFPTHYVDYLCVHKDHRSKGIAQQVIQTHEYNQRVHTEVVTSLFKREGNLNAMVPIVVFRTYGFNIEYWRNKVDLHPQLNLVTINKNNIGLLTNFIKSHKAMFKFHVCPAINILIDLITSNNIMIYGLLQDSNVIALYFLRDSSTYYNQRKAVECFASINNCLSTQLFVYGFSKILKLLQSKFSYLLIENISHNYKIIENIIEKHTPCFVSPTAYYFYNFAMRPIKEQDSLIIC